MWRWVAIACLAGCAASHEVADASIPGVDADGPRPDARPPVDARPPPIDSDVRDAACVERTFFADADGDGAGTARTTTSACAPPVGYVAAEGDCDDTDPSVQTVAQTHAPRPLAPENGARTGSPHGAAVGTLRPTLAWQPTPCALDYQVQIDDSCTIDAFATCALPSPSVDVRVAGTRYRPEVSLEVDERPAGRRYYWRVRPCADDVCGAWSAVRYVDVGRTPMDFDGDGYAELVVGAPRTSTGVGAVFVYRGGPGGLDPIPTRIDEPTHEPYATFGSALAGAHDVDADGYDDLLVAAAAEDGDHINEGAVFLYRGGPSGLASQPSQVLLETPPGEQEWFGHAIAAVGDVNADGYADAIVSTRSIYSVLARPRAAYVFLGGPTALASMPIALIDPTPSDGSEFGYVVGAAGDPDADGFADILVRGDGVVHLYPGSSDGPSTRPAVTLSAFQLPELGVAMLAAGDLDGDDLSDLVLASPGNEQIAIFHGRIGGVVAEPSMIVRGPPVAGHTQFGSGLAAGDLEGDGRTDLWVASAGVGHVDGYAPSSRGLEWAGVTVVGPPDPSILRGFAQRITTLDANGDGVAELYVSAPVYDPGTDTPGWVLAFPSWRDPAALVLVDPTGEHSIFGDTLAR